MYVVRARNVNDAIIKGMDLLQNMGVSRSSRNGDVHMMDMPVTTVYERPTERVLFWPERDANPFFHLYEAVWMLGGCNDVERVRWFVKTMGRFSNDGLTFEGAYGYRWLRYFDRDQLEIVASRLRDMPDDRRSVVGMWDPSHDLSFDNRSKDVPCNTHIYFGIVDGRLDMTVCNRSNDIIWGCYGANVVHFSFMQEYMAHVIGVPVGRYFQMSNNFHAYDDVFLPLISKPRAEFGNDYYRARQVEAMPLIQNNEDIRDFNQDMMEFLMTGPKDAYAVNYRTVFFNYTLRPMVEAYAWHKQGNTFAALRSASQIAARDWGQACTEWLDRRLK